ncbi:TPA: hypothetical protein EYO57_13720 [Candidatus Poribacteria bacterium]|nr:hypothetical protein [Candidatus Poribacteria bacterium]
MAAAVEAETRETGFLGASLRLTLYCAYMKQLLQERQPALCILWHQFNGNHVILAHQCQDLGIPYLYMEYAALPGTICFDEDGPMAESWVAQRYDEFLALPVDDSDLAQAQCFLDYLKEGKKSGKPQDSQVSIQSVVERAREQGRKIIFYAGQNDWASGMLPRGFPEARIHSHIYSDTLDALGHLSEVAEENDWQIVFKPHPLVQERHRYFEVPFPERVDLVLGGNILDCIQETDVVTTIVSQVSYLALIHGRPCVMLGRNQLRNKGCTYQVGPRDDLAPTIQHALGDGFHGKARARWLKHVAQICKYYLFALDPEVESIIGRDVQEAADFLVKRADMTSLSAASRFFSHL